MIERDDERGAMFDHADEDRRYDEWRQEQDEEREARLFAALDALVKGGISKEHIRTLAFEAGAVRWALEASIKREPTWFKDGEI